MKKAIYILLMTAVLFVGCNMAFTQNIYHVCGTEAVKLRAGNFQYGTIHWERSIDNIHWETIHGAKDTIYEFVPEEDIYYRAVSVYSECPAEYSDIAYVQLPPEANAGLDRVTPSASMFMQANLPPSAIGTWRIIEGKGSITISDVHDPYALVQGDYGIYQFEWALTNTCGVSKDTVEVELIQNKFTDDLVIVDDTDVIQSTADQLEEGIYIILFSEPVPDITTNTYLVGITTEDGFLRKVDAFTRNDNHYICHTSQATLEDIIEEGGFSFDQVFIIDESIFTEKDGVTYAGHYARLDHKPTRKELTTDPKFKENDYFYIVEEDRVYLYPGVELNHPTDKSTKIGLTFNSVILTANNLNIKLGGHYWFKPNFVADIKVKWFKLRYFKLGLSNATVERQIHLITTASTAVNISNRNYTLYSKHKNYQFIIAGVPVWIKSEFSIGGKLSANTNGNVSITQGMKETITYNAYIEYKKSWKYVFNEKATTQPVLTHATNNNLTQAIDFGPRLSFSLYGVIGPYVGVGVKQDFNLCFRSDDWNTRMKLSGIVYVGARARILGKTLFDTSKTWSTGLYSHQFPHGLKMIGGNNQTYEPGKSLAQKVKVQVISDKAFQLPGATVWFTPKDGGSVQNSMVRANASGIAETVWTPGGSQSSRLEARILDCSGKDIKNSPLVFNANANTSGIDCVRSSLSMSIERSGLSVSPKPFLGKPPYTYFANGINYGSQIPSLVSSPGTSYSFIIKDNSNCLSNDNMNEPAINCDLSDLRIETTVMGSTIEAIGKGGVPPYQYSLNSGTSGFGTNNAFNGLSLGTLTIYVRDAAGCIKSAEVSVTDNKPPIIADFMADKTSIKPGESVHFENLSNNAMSWAWNFGDGKTSIEQNPTHIYETAGSFTVSLAVKNTYAADKKTIQNYITVMPEAGSRRQPCPDTPTVTDSDGNIYEAILIGHQCWMAENLKTTSYTDGTPIDFPGGDSNAWENNTTGAYTWYLNDPGNKNVYGALYNWHAVNNSDGLCPAGWHVPSDAEWTQMTNYLIDNHDDITSANVKNKLKSCRQVNSPLGGDCVTEAHPRWDATDTTYGTDDVGFSGLPGGICSTNGAYFMLGERGKWWSSTLGPYVFTIKQETANNKLPGHSSSAGPSLTAWGRTLSVHNVDIFREPIIIENGLSIRCVRSEGQEVVLPSVVTSPVTDVTGISASGGGHVDFDGGAFVSARGICWSASQNPTTADNKTTDGSGTGTFFSNLTGLTPGTTYYVRAYASNSLGTAYGNQVQFTTAGDLPSVTTNSITNITQTTATGGGNVTSDGGAAVTARGVCWGTSQNPTLENHQGMTTDGAGTGGFASNMTGLSPGRNYYVRAYATNSAGTAYGSQVQFTAGANLPDVTTRDISSITKNTATSGGYVVSDGGATVTTRGICWSTSQNPSIQSNMGMTSNGSGRGGFTSYLTGLSHATTYYVRAYATNSAGTAYGDEVIFTTDPDIPVVTTASITNITYYTAAGGGNVNSDGGATVTARGICWSTSQNPTTQSNLGMTSDGAGTGTFTSSLTGLAPGTTYYVRAYATNSAGTAYGNQATFKTEDVKPPSVTTTAITSITQTTATGGGQVTDNGGLTVVARGICWSTSPNPTIGNNHGMTNNGSGMGAFSSNLTGLTLNTTYYVRAYATNNAGTAYGEQRTFNTLPSPADPPTITTKNITNIYDVSATGGGNVTSDGGASVTARGVCWSTSQNPTILNNQGMTSDGSGTGSFTSQLTGLTPYTKYYVRAYATNSGGTAYGNQVEFTTWDSPVKHDKIHPNNEKP